MYIERFSLQRHPFRITPDPALFFPGGRRGEILDALTYAITTGEGIIKVVGEVGSGKTMLCRMLEERLPESVEIVYLANPGLSPHDILYAIVFELKIPVDLKTERLVVMQKLQEYLLKQHTANRSVVVFIEEAQGMPLETLEEIRLLSNLETHQNKLLQLVLFGQPELEKNLERKAIRQLKERITHSFLLPPLNKDETAEYIRFRLQAVGCAMSSIFSKGAEQLIARASRGLIRRINILADKALLAAYAYPASTEKSKHSPAIVRSSHVRAAISDSEFNLPFFRPAHFMGVGAVALAIILIVSVNLALFDMVSFSPDFSLKHSAPQSAAVFDSTVVSIKAKNTNLAQNDNQQGSVGPAVSGNEGLSQHRIAVEVEPSASVISMNVVPQSVEIIRSSDGRQKNTDERRRSAGTEEAKVLPNHDELRVVANLNPVVSTEPSTHPPSVTPPLQAEKQVRQSLHELPQQVAVTTGQTLTQSRLAATIKWLQNVNADNYTIQLNTIAVDQNEYVEEFLLQISKTHLLDKIYVCPARHGERDMLVIIYDNFQGVTPARLAIDALPDELRRFQPFVRSIDKVLRAYHLIGPVG